MTHPWDEFSKSLAESVPRRESLRRLGAVFAGAVLSPLAIPSTWARGPDPCKAFCRCRNKTQQNACIAACRGCNSDTSRLCGTCGTYVCCPQPGPNEYGACIDGQCAYACVQGAVRCDGSCTFLDWDPNNCGGCGNVCPASTPYCDWGNCSECPAGQTKCNGFCADLNNDPFNCGVCGNVCAGGHVCFFATCCNPTVQCCGPDCVS